MNKHKVKKFDFHMVPFSDEMTELFYKTMFHITASHLFQFEIYKKEVTLFYQTYLQLLDY